MNSKHTLFLCAIGFAALAGFQGCGRQEIQAWQPGSESERRLAERIEQFYSCGQQHNHEAMYGMFASTLKGHADKNEWLSVFAAEEDPGDGVISFVIVSVELSDTLKAPVPLKQPIASAAKVALVEMKIVRRRRGEEMSDTALDTWVWEDEDWRFGGTD